MKRLPPRRLFFAAVAAALGLMATGLGPRAARAQTVDEIVRRGTINIGVLGDLPPYSFLNDKQELDGYDVEVAKLLASYLGVKPNLVQVTASNRIAFLVTNKVDLIVATFGITPERARQVMFSNPYSAIENTVFGAKGKTIKGMADLKGLRVGVPRGTVQDVIITKALGNGARIQRFDDSPSTFQAMLTGQVDAMAETGLTFANLLKANPGADVEAKFLLLRQPNGVSMRADQFNLRQWVNTTLFYMKNNGELEALHQKWFNAPLPGFPNF